MMFRATLIALGALLLVTAMASVSANVPADVDLAASPETYAPSR
jgi:hypothetical protein